MVTTTSKKVSSSGLLKVVETKVDCNYSAVDGIQIDKVLDNVAICGIVQSEKVNEALDIVGKVTLTSIYVDTEKVVHSSRNMVDFNEKVQLVDADAVVVVPKVKNIKTRKETSVFVNATIYLELEIYGVCQENLNYIEPNSGEISELTEEIVTDNLLCFNNSQIEQSETMELEQGAEIIAVYSNLLANKVIPNGNYVTLDAEIVREVVYNAGGVIKKAQKRSDVTEEISLLNCTADTPCAVKCFINNENYESTEDSDAKLVVKIDTTIAISIWGYETQKFTVIKDAYSCEKKLNIGTETFVCSDYEKSTIYSDQLSIVKDMANTKRVDEVLFVGNNFIKVESATIIDGNIVISGTISQNLVCKNYDNDDIFNSVIESEFKTALNVSANENLEFDYILNAKCMCYKNKAGKEIVLNYNLDTLLNSKTCKTEYFINSVEEVGVNEPSEYSIVVYKPEPEEKVFDIAKRLCVTPDCVLSQNPEIVDGKPIERVIIYRKMSAKI